MFEKNLTDLVRGIRNNKSNEAKYIAACLDEIKQELRQENAAVKANAVAKLTYLVSTKPYIRKRAVLLMYKIFLKFPEALRPAFPRLKEKLEDGEPGVQSAAVNVICELARKNPKNYLSLAPLFFKLMTSSTNNWMLIKIIKLFGALCPLEPRLGKKLLEPLTNLIHSTSAMSLLYECINTVISGLPQHNASIQLCVSKLRILIEDSDQNLKYLGLLAMSKILTVNAKAVQVHKDIVLQCLDDKDESIRLRALDLIVGMVSKKNIMDIIKKLMVQIDKADSQTYCDEILSKIIQICSMNDYHYVTNFEWYIDVLIQLTRVEGTRLGKQLASQMMDVTIRVKAIRPYGVQCLSLLLDNNELLSGQMEKNRVCEVLYAAAWISGEFSEHLPDIHSTLEAMLQTKVTSLPGHIQAVYVQNIAKLYAKLLASEAEEEEEDEKTSVGEMLVERLPVFVQSADLEVQERVKSSEEEEEIDTIFDTPNEHKELRQKYVSDDEEEMQKRREQRKQEQMSNPHYLKMSSREERKAKKKEMAVDDIPVANLDLPVSLKVSGGMALDKKYASAKKSKKRRKKGRKGSRADEEEPDLGISYEVLPAGAGELPEGADDSDHEDKGNDEAPASDPHKLLDVDLSKPLEAHEALPVRQHRVVLESQQVDGEENEETPKKHGKDKKHRHRRDSEGKKGKHKHKRDKEDKDKKSKHKHRHHRKDEGTEPVEDNLMFNGEVDHVESPSRDDSHQESETTTPSKEITEVEDFKPSADEPGDPQDDMDFWLSSTPQKKSSPPPAEVAPTPSPDSAAEKTRKEEKYARQSEKSETKESKRKHRKDKSEKKEKHEKERKKEKRKGKTSEKPDSPETAAAEPENQYEPTITELEEEKKQPVITTYKVLAENGSLRLMYETRVTTQNRNQVVVSVIFSNLSDRHIKSMEFNVLDSLNTKLIRPIGSSSRDSVPVPFHLLPESSNEGQFAFTVESIVMVQKLRGTLTYVIKDDEGSTSEKMDFSLFLPCSSFLISTPLSSTDFTNLLGSGTVVHKVVEQVDNSASLYACSIQGHHLCALVKQLPDHSVSVDGKSTDSSLVSSVLEEIKALLQAPA
ncbi:hypothetical protein pdam_00021484 [Pocillopora damicornis]|uniref:AP-3 complex subunit delta domain-containing protein n=1 Tax=Pocillopora damicornis TaxID=46731 RepID=A0A3M6UD95_POCDA|nr:hypothetical protein pdam_00021484 [Pocillopora damicornis]